MPWLKAKLATPCFACSLLMQPGERIFPCGDEEGVPRYMHLSCAEARAPPGAAEPEAPVCKHWRSRGLCCYGDSCVFRHPPECLAALRQRRAEDAARAAATTRSLPAGGRRPGQRRAQSKNRFRASSFRRFLLDTFGRERLGAGAGVLDVAGGKGELAFELVNLNACPATVLEPRPLELHKRVGWLLSGYYTWNVAFNAYNQEWLAGGAAAQQQQPGAARMPAHLRMVVTPELAACLTASRPAAVDSSSSSNSSTSSGGSSEDDICRILGAEDSLASSLSACSLDDPEEGSAAADDAPAEAPPPGWAAVFERARLEAQLSRWQKPSAPHERTGTKTAGKHEREEGCAGSGDTTAAPHPPSTPELADMPAAAPAAAAAPPVRRPAVAWSIPADSESEDDLSWCSMPAAMQLDQQQQALPPPQHSPQQRPDPQQLAAAAACAEVRDAGEAWRTLTRCSVVVGMHPDQATEFIVDLALAHNKPFAVVPCCVYSCEFPHRRSVAGQPVASHDQFLDYLCAKDPGNIRVATLPFEGRNKVLYRVV